MYMHIHTHKRMYTHTVVNGLMLQFRCLVAVLALQCIAVHHGTILSLYFSLPLLFVTFGAVAT